MMFFAVTLTIIGNLQLFEEPFILTGGTGVAEASNDRGDACTGTAFVDGDFGTASAIACCCSCSSARRHLGQQPPARAGDWMPAP